MLVRIYTVVDKKKGKSTWIVAADGGIQMRGVVGESPVEVREQWERVYGKISKAERRPEMPLREVIVELDDIRQKWLGSQTKQEIDDGKK